MIDYSDAVAAVRAKLELGWSLGTFCIDDREIVENDEFYVVKAGARDFIIDGDISYVVVGGVPVVDKATGEVRSERSVDVAMDRSIRRSINPNPSFK